MSNFKINLVHMGTIYWHMNAMQGGANLHPGVNLHPGANLHLGANCAYEHGLKLDSRKRDKGKHKSGEVAEPDKPAQTTGCATTSCL